MIRVLVVEDSPTARELLTAILRADPDVEVVGEAVDGRAGVELTRRLRPDVVTMDIQLPGIDGFEATRRIMAEAPTPIVIVSGTVDVGAVATSMRALAVGALAVLPRPEGPMAADFDETARHFVDTLKALSAVKVVRRWRASRPPVHAPRPRGGAGTAAEVVAIAASTGGPAALRQVLGDLGAAFPAPVLVVQHMSPGFTGGFVAWLGSTVPLRVKLAAEGEALAPGTIYVAPDDRHLGAAAGNVVALSQAPRMDGFRPSGTALFESVAGVYGSGMVAVVLTGMGQDGVEGLRAVRERGGRIVVQDEDTSVVFGMPGAAVQQDLYDDLLPLGAIGPRVAQYVRPVVQPRPRRR